MEEVAWIGGFVLVADKANIWVALGVSAMFIGFNLKNARVARWNPPNYLVLKNA